MDIYDKATEVEEKARELSLKFRKPELEFTGQCHNCEESVPPPARFCDTHCRDDYELREKHRHA